MEATLGIVTPSIVLSTADFIRFIEKNSDMGWNTICTFVSVEGYISEEGEDYFTNETPDSKRVEKHGCDYEYEFLKAHPQLDGYEVRVVFDD